MADNIFGDVPTEFQPEMQNISQQQKLSQMLLQQGMQQPQGQMISGRYVAPALTQYLAPLLSAYAGSKGIETAEQKQLELAKAIRIQGDAAAKDVMETYKTDPNAALTKALQYQQFPQVKAVLPSLSESLKPSTLEKEFNAAKAQGYKGSINDFKNQMSEKDIASLAIDKQRLGLEGARLGMEQQRLAQELGGAKLTDTQGNATAFGVRMKESNQLLNDLEKKGVANTGIVRSTIAGTAGMTPFIGEKLQQGIHAGMNVLPSALGGPSSEQQQVDAARRNFVTAVLRKESGAAISPSEFYNESQKYFPQPGDSDAVISQKRHARDTAIKAMEIQAGPGKRFIEETGAKKVVNFNDLP